jgi:hypothetical protein
LLCGIITIIPIIVSIIVQGQIVNNPSTHIFTKGGSIVDKQTFLFLLIATSLLYYFIAIMISEKFTLFDKSYFRITIKRFAFWCKPGIDNLKFKLMNRSYLRLIFILIWIGWILFSFINLVYYNDDNPIKLKYGGCWIPVTR